MIVVHTLRYPVASEGLYENWEDVMKAEPMCVEETEQDEVVVLAVRGLLAYRPNVSPFYDRLTDLKQMGRTRVVVDCSSLNGCGAALLGWLVSGQKMLREAGGDLCLAGVSQHMQHILKLTRLNNRFVMFKTTDRAVAQFHKEPLVPAA